MVKYMFRNDLLSGKNESKNIVTMSMFLCVLTFLWRGSIVDICIVIKRGKCYFH